MVKWSVIRRSYLNARRRYMIITGALTLVVAAAYWYLFPFLCSMLLRHPRFWFPDSPTTARFLTPRERAIAIERIKVNQTGVENKRFVRDPFQSLCLYENCDAETGTVSSSNNILTRNLTVSQNDRSFNRPKDVDIRCEYNSHMFQ